MMIHTQRIIVLGATGATGRLVVAKLLENGEHVSALVRSIDKGKSLLGNHPNLELIEGTVLSLEEDRLIEVLKGAKSVISCLGHNISFKGMYGKPHKLVTDSLKKVCHIIKDLDPETPKKVVLMNTTGFRNAATDPSRSFRERLVIGLLRLILPPHTDNEAAANYLLHVVGTECRPIHWVIIRPDTLIDQPEETSYSLSEVPVRSPIFNSGETSRINAASFMAELAMNLMLMDLWKFRSPIIYNADSMP